MASFLNEVHSVILHSIPSFTSSLHKSNDNEYLLLMHVKLFDHPPLGKTSRIKITVSSNQEYKVHCMFEEIEKGFLEKPGDITALCEHYSSESVWYKFCPGFSRTEYDAKYFSVIGYHVKGIRVIDMPAHRIESSRCLKWHKIGKTSSKERKASELLCRSCIIQRSHLDRQVQQKLAESPTRKAKRQYPSSSAKMSCMSPFSQNKRKENQRSRTHTLKSKLDKYKDLDINLADEQDQEMESAMEVIEKEGSKELEELFEEGEKHGVGQKLHEIWSADKRQRKQDSKKDQDYNGKS